MGGQGWAWLNKGHSKAGGVAEPGKHGWAGDLVGGALV